MLDRLLDLPTGPRRTILLVGAIALVAAVFRLPGLGYPGEEYFDEVYHAKTALQYLRGEPPTEWVHPPTAKLLIAVGVALFGYHPWAWRLAPAVAGILLAPVFFLLARRVAATERAALLATFLLLVDGVYLVQSRIAMTNVFAVLFQLLSALLLVRAATLERLRCGHMATLGLAPVFFLLARRVAATERAALLATFLLLVDGVYLVQSRIAMTNVFAVLFQLLSALLLVRAATLERLRCGHMATLGLALGLALSTRWTSLFAWGFLGLAYVALRRERAFRARELALGFLAFALLPVLVYLLSYVPWMEQAHPHGLSEWWGRVRDAVTTQRAIWRYHADLTATHAYFSRWWTWPLLYRPTWYFWWSGGGVVRGIVALGNPAIWWASVPAAAWAAITGVRWRDPRRLFAGAGFFFLYLPWGLSPRTLNFSHYLFEAIPYACLSLGIFLDRVWDGRHPLLPRAYVILAIGLFLLFLPFLTAIPVPIGLWGYRFPLLGGGLWTWFPTWV